MSIGITNTLGISEMAYLFILCYIVFVVVYFTARKLYYAAKDRRKALDNGCLPPPHRKTRLPGGLDYLIPLLKAVKKNQHLELMQANHEKIGLTYSSCILGTDSIVTIEPENIKSVLSTDFKSFGLGPLRCGNWSAVLGDGIFSVDGRKWEHSRMLLRPQFAKGQVSDVKELEKHVQNFLKRLWVNSGEVVNLEEFLYKLTMDTSTEFLFGKSVYSLLQNEGETVEGKMTFAEAFNECQVWLAFRQRLQGLWYLGNGKGFRKCKKIVHDYVDNLVLRCLADLKDPAVSEEKKTKYVFLNELAKETQDPKVLRDQCVSILLAGRDTTAVTLTWALVELSQHPVTYARLRKQTLERFGTSTEDITFGSLKEFHFLQHIIHETMRLYPAVPLNQRMCSTDTVLPVGGGPDGKSPVYCKKGTRVDYNVHAMHRRKDIWGMDAEKFVPERWETGRPPNWAYLPFNGGPRICLGQQYAMTNMAYVLVRFAQTFERIECADWKKELGSTLVITSGRGCKVRLYSSERK